MKIEIPYGKGTITADVKEERVAGVIHSGLDEYVPEAGEEELIRRAMRSPGGCVTLREMAVGKKKVVINSSHRVIGAFAGDMEDALAKAEEIAGRKASVTFLPEGMSAITE
ncbi:MAG: DUF2088 domain-containing protein [Lachnospiraceae bacterium]|nr:DUF2088 domain-containing protein [Lachnospiraceae bacterium]